MRATNMDWVSMGEVIKKYGWLRATRVYTVYRELKHVPCFIKNAGN